MSAPLFTVVMPTRNRARMLPTALRSLLWQTCGDFECIVMDDGSKDATPEVFKRFGNDPRFSWHRFEERGVAWCRNFALKRAKGRFVKFLDDDDIWLPGHLEAFKAAAEKRPKVGFWFCNAYVWRYDRVIGRMFEPGRAIPEGALPGHYAIGDRYLPYVTTTMSIAREAFDRVGEFHEAMPILADTAMVVRVLDAGFEAGVLHEPLAVRRLHDAQVTKDHTKAFEESALLLQTAKLSDEHRESLRRDIALEIGGYLLKNMEPEKLRAFLGRSGIKRDARYALLYAGSCLPRFLLVWLYGIRKLALELRYAPGLAGREFRDVDALVRPLLDA